MGYDGSGEGRGSGVKAQDWLLCEGDEVGWASWRAGRLSSCVEVIYHFELSFLYLCSVGGLSLEDLIAIDR